MSNIIRLSFIAGIFTLTLFVTIKYSSTVSPQQHNPQRSGAMEALDFWTQARAYPYPDIAPDKHYNAYQQIRKFKKEQRSPFANLPGWNYIGPDNLSGRMISVTLNPQNPNTIYAGAASGGLWRSYTGGVAGDWHRVATGFPVLGVGAIAINPADSNVMYIGTGEVYRYGGSLGGLVIRTTRGSYGIGILKTTDGGTTWAKSLDWSYNQQSGVQAIKTNPLNPGTVWAATTEGIYKSTNAGATWTLSLLVYMGQDIVIHPVDTNRVIVSVGNLDINPAIFRTSDGGSNWEIITPTGFSGKTLLDSPPSFPDIVYASIADSTTGVGSLWRTTNFGDTWTQMSTNVTNNIFGVQGWYSHYVAVFPTDANIVFHASVGASKSSNGGVTFTGTGGLYSDNHDFAYDPLTPNILYSANDDGIYRSTNFGATFTQVNGGLGTGQLYNGFSNSTTDSLIALVQSQDHIPGYLYQGSTTWALSAADESGWTAIDPLNDSIMYAVTRFGQTIRKSINRGASFPAGVSLGTNGAWNSPVVISPSNPSILYVGKTRIYKSTNSSASWAATNGNTDLDGNPALAMAISATDPDTVYVGMAPYVTNAHLFRTTNGGTSWTNITGTLPDRYPLDLAVDPDNSQIVYAAFGGFGTGHIFKTTNAGSAWTDISGTLPDIPVTAILVDPQNSNVVYIGTDIGVHVSTNGGATWNTFDEGLPEAIIVSDLSMTASNRTIRVGTHGNGAFERKMPGNLPLISVVTPNGGESWQVGAVHVIQWEEALIPSVKLEYTTDNGSTWSLIATNVNWSSTGYQWTIPPVTSTQTRIKATSLADTAIFAQSANPFTIYFDGTIVSVKNRWNLVSLPVEVTDHSRTTLFPGATSDAFGYETSYVTKDSIAEGHGYWIKYNSDNIIPISGDTLDNATINISAGWNLIGSLTNPINVGTINTVPPGIITTNFYGYNGSYFPTDSLLQGNGYWVKTNSPGTMTLSSASIAKRTTNPRNNPLANLNTLVVTDARGNSQTLYFGYQDNRINVDLYEMPPVPPAGGFDARFGTNRLVELFGESAGAQPIIISSNFYPVTIEWNVINTGQSQALLIDGNPISLRGKGTTQVTNPISRISLSKDVSVNSTTPQAFTLYQNYPNPFNPSTEIRYDIADEENVTLTIYSLLGEEITTLVNEQKSPGSYTAFWNAHNQPSGIYISRLSYRNVTLSRKMLLLK